MLGRFYASVHPFRVECPRCGYLIICTRRGQVKRQVWNRHLSRLKCPGCGKAYVVGLLLWDVSKNWESPNLNKNAPPDTIPSREQLAELRREVGGFWAPMPLPRGGRAHRVVDAPCSCPPLPWRDDCPIHGLQGPELDEVVPEVKPEPGRRYFDTVTKQWVRDKHQLTNRGKPTPRQKEAADDGSEEE